MGRFYAFLMLFQGAMLGIVLSDNVLLLIVFWELTSISSFLLIGFWRLSRSAEGARMALAVTGGGGLALLAGVLVLGSIAGSYDLTTILANREVIQASPLYPLALVLILIGCFTKSAQFPFHFWLPHAMAAPTPVSAYLHSATMVKAGVFLLARLWPVLAGTDLWFYLVATTGPGDDADRRRDRAVQQRPQGAARLFDGEPPRLPDDAVRLRDADGGGGRRVPHPQPRHLQGGAVHDRRHHRP
jgi:multicomponent K+:H+ antiporter subunit A